MRVLAQEVFLSNMDLNEAINLYFNKLFPIKSEVENVITWDAAGRVSYFTNLCKNILSFL